MKELNKEYGDFSNYERINKKYALPIVIDKFTMHQLRHTYCSMLYDADVDLLTAKYLMGHKNVSTTLKIYTHLHHLK